MRLTLFVTTLCVVCSGIASAAASNCQHDGYFNGTTCVCKPGFKDNYCQTRVCMNDGTPREGAFNDNGCYCPPGFIGINCQPTKCVDGDSKAFYADESDKMISVYIPSNTDLQIKTATNDNPMQAICDTFSNSSYYQLLVYYGSHSTALPRKDCLPKFQLQIQDDCWNDDDQPDNCTGTDPSSINVQAISDVVDKTSPNSQMFIITNYPLANVEDKDVQAVVKKAISKRLTIHSLVFTTPEVMDFTLYQNANATGYQALRTIAESTLGAYVTPYSGTASNTFGADNNQKAATQLLLMTRNGINPAAMYSTRTPAPNVLFVGNGQDFYISSRVNGDNYNPFSSTFFNFSAFNPLSPGFSYIINTGYYRMAKAKATSDVISFVMNDRTLPQSNFVIFTKKTAAVYPAITTSDLVDASAPFGDIASGSRSLVGKLVHPNMTLNPVHSFFYPSGIVTFVSSNATRTGCQFPITLGTVQCTKHGAAFLQLRTNDIIGSVTPFYCAGETQPSNVKSFEFEEEFNLSDDDDLPTCTDDGKVASKLTTNKRGFVIISRNAREIDPDTKRTTANSPVDRLYINKGNVFSYLLKQNVVYQQFVYNLIDSTSVTNTVSTDQPQSFMDNVMNITAGAGDVNDNVNLLWLTALKDTALFVRNSQKVASSDIFLVIDNGTFSVNFETDVKLFEDLYTSRSRLFILALDTYGSYASLTNQSMAIAAARTGGTMLRFKDYDDLHKFFDNYFLSQGNVSISQSDVVYQRLIPFSLTVQTDSIRMPPKLETEDVSYTLVIYGTTKVLAVTPTCTSPGTAGTTGAPQATLNATSTFGEATIFSLSSLQGDNVCSFYIMFAGPQAKAINIVVYAKNQKLPLTIKSIVGFSNSQDVSVSQPFLNFALKTPQLPVATQPNTVLTILDSSRNIILNNNMTTRESCSGFNSLLNHNFQCTKSNDFYYFQTTFADSENRQHIRTFVTQCISESGKCLNGGNNENGICVCPVGFIGTICETPICQNGGTVTPANTCTCVSGFTGDFCEISNATCINSPSIPDSRSEVTSLIFVMEATDELKFPVVQNNQQLPGVQITVVKWNCDATTTTQLGTDATKLSSVNVTGSTTCGTSSDYAISALLEGFNSQTTDRAVVVFFLNSGFAPTNSTQDIFNKLASQRIDLRIFSTQDSNANLDLLAQFGNGIVYQDVATNFEKYFTNYIAALFQPKVIRNGAGVPRLAVAQSGTGPVQDLPLLRDDAEPSSITYIVHTFNATNVTVTGTQTATPKIQSSSRTSKIWFISVTQDATFTITGDGSTKYSIEKMTTLPLAFGFQDSGINERLQLGLRTGVTNYLSLYTPRSQDGETLAAMPKVIVTKIGIDGNSSAPMILPTTHKNHECVYSYYSIPITCNNSTLGYSANILTFTSFGKPRQEQKMLVCQKADQGICVNGQLVDGTCVCNDGWTGLECNLPICAPGSSRVGSVCMCAPGTTGDNCGTNDVETTVSPNAKRAFVFILDSRGADENLYNMSIATIQDFMAMYNPDSLVLFVSNMGNASEDSFLSYNPNTMTTSIEKLRILRNNNNIYQDVAPAFDTIYDKVQAASQMPSFASAFDETPQKTDINNIFYMALTGVSLSSSTSMERLKTSYAFKVSSVFFTATDAISDLAKNQTSTIITSLGSNFKVANNPNDAFLFMRNESSGSPITPTIPTIRSYSCVKDVQANIYIMTELSNVTNLGTYRQTYGDFLKYFRSDFERSAGYLNVSANRTADPQSCGVDLNRFAAQSLISGFPYYNYVTGSVTYSFCTSDSNYKQFEKAVADPTKIGGPSPQWPRLTTYISSYLRNTCQCSRMNDTSTLKIAVWMPVTKAEGADYNQFLDNKFVHLVLPFGFDIPKDSFYYNLANSNNASRTDQQNPFTSPTDYILPKADPFTATQLVQQVWTKICQITNKISTDSTAAPPQVQYVEQDDMQKFYGESETEF